MLPYPSLVLVRPRKTGPCLTERLLMGRKESNQTNKNILLPCVLYCIRFKITSVCVTGQEKIVSLSSCRTSAILKYFCPLVSILHVFAVVLELAIIFQNFTDQPWVCFNAMPNMSDWCHFIQDMLEIFFFTFPWIFKK